MPKPFRLQPVLKYRMLREDQQRQQLAEVLGRKGSIKAALAEQHRHCQALEKGLEKQQKDGISVQDLQLFKARIDRQHRQIRQLEEKVARLQQETTARREELREASRDRQLLDNLRERFHADQRREEQRREALLMDEISLKYSQEER